MLSTQALWLIGVPLVLFLIGTVSKKQLLLVVGSIGLVVAGALVLVSPLATQNLANTTTAYTYQNVTDAGAGNWTWQLNATTDNYGYTQTPFSDNDNLFLGTMIAFLGIAGIGYGAVIRG